MATTTTRSRIAAPTGTRNSQRKPAPRTPPKTIKVRLDRVRMAMPGEFYAYDVSVPVDQPGLDRADYSYFSVRTDTNPWTEYVTFADATTPAGHREMPKGWPRYQAWLAHEKRAFARSWEILRTAFPELAGIPPCSLWVEIPGFDASHAAIDLEVEVGL